MVTSNNLSRKVLKLVCPSAYDAKYNPIHKTKMDYTVPDDSPANLQFSNCQLKLTEITQTVSYYTSENTIHEQNEDYEKPNVVEDHILNFLPKPMRFRILNNLDIYNIY